MDPAMMQALTCVTLALLMLGSFSRALVAGQPADDPDQLYAGREDVANALAAADVWERRLAEQTGDYESATA